METSTLLVEVRHTISTGWCQYAAAMDHLGSRVSPVSPDARKWSLLGAVLKETEGGEFERVLEVLKVPCDTVYIDTWNNTDGRTQADVLCMLNNVILEEMAKESGSLSHEPSKNL